MDRDTRVPVWLDCDPGHDDAMAMILAGYDDKIHLLGVSTVAGNQSIEKVTKNALDILELTGLNDIDVVQGAARAIVRKVALAPEIHGESGLDGCTLPTSSKTVLKKNCVLHMFETIMKHPVNVTIVATGMLTNVALLLRTFPEVQTKITEIVLMGGAIGIGNYSPCAEFNIWNDPEAAHIVFHSGLKVVMVPLEVTHTATCTKEIIKGLHEKKTRMCSEIAGLMVFFTDAYFQIFKFPDPPIHDPCAVLYVIDKTLFETTEMNVEVELASPISVGRTICDVYNVTKGVKNVTVCTKMNVKVFWEKMLSAIEKGNAVSKYGVQAVEKSEIPASVVEKSELPAGV
jgi:purine nucleosidase